MRSTLRELFGLIVFLALIGLCWTVFQFAPEFAAVPVVIIAVAAALLGFSTSLWSYRSLGAAVLIVPFFGYQGLNIVVAAWLSGRWLRSLLADASEPAESFPTSRVEAELGFVVLVLAWGAAGLRTWHFEYDRLLYEEIARGGGLSGLLRFVVYNPLIWNKVPLLICGYILSAFVLETIGRREEAGRGFLEGLAGGAIISSLVLFLQRADLWSGWSFNRGVFWVMTERYPGTASDPNAFGVLAGLLVPGFLLYRPERLRKLFTAAAVCLAAAAPWTGSRTFWLGLIVGGIYALYRRTESRRRFLGAVGGVILIALLLGVPPVNYALQQRMPAPGLIRVLQTINWEQGAMMFANRVSFARIAISVWEKAPVLGVGLGRFYDHQAAAASEIGIELGAWRDNANNFYLQVLSEGGLLGLALVIFSFMLFARALHAAGVTAPRLELARFSLGALLVLLLTGPHLLFDEVKYVFAGLLAAGVCEAAALGAAEVTRTERQVRRWAALAALAVLVFFVHSGERPAIRGVYQKEHGAEGSFLWTTSQAGMTLCPTGKNEVIVRFQALNPDLAANPLAVTVSVERGASGPDVRQVSISSAGWRELRVPLGEAWPANRPIELAVRSSRTWSPSVGNPIGDPRWFGVMLAYPEDLCPERIGGDGASHAR